MFYENINDASKVGAFASQGDFLQLPMTNSAAFKSMRNLGAEP